MNQIIYYLYHIPGKKIGVTRNLKSRLTVQQGYQPGEYEVLETSLDIDYISDREAELQSIYGYNIDRDTYKSLMNKFKTKKQMKLNVTAQTTTFPCPLNKLKGQLMDSVGFSFNTPYGHYVLDQNMIDWIIKNATTSMFNASRCFIYNKALSEWHKSYNYPLDSVENIDVNDHVDMTKKIKEILEANEVSRQEKLKNSKAEFRETFRRFEEAMTEAERRKSEDELPNVYDLIRQWATNKGIYDWGDSKTQYIKLMEEAGELAEAILKQDKAEIKDAIGDMVVVLTNLAALEELNIEDCITSAYTVIKDRTGKMENGTFVKTATKRVLNSHLTSTL